jgi:drug/metabolite transporter (DMT)-like permease
MPEPRLCCGSCFGDRLLTKHIAVISLETGNCAYCETQGVNQGLSGVAVRYGRSPRHLFLLADTTVQTAFGLAADHAGKPDMDLEWPPATAGSPIFRIAIGPYLTVFVLWMMILQQTDLSRAFPLSALTYVTVPAAGLLLFHETVSLERSLGVAPILASVVLAEHEQHED